MTCARVRVCVCDAEYIYARIIFKNTISLRVLIHNIIYYTNIFKAIGLSAVLAVHV